jgi:hypothetical protein
MKRANKNIIHEMRMFLSVPIVVHVCILNLVIKLTKLSIKESKYFKQTIKKNKHYETDFY